MVYVAWLGRDLKSWKLARFPENVQGRLLRLVKDSGTQDGLPLTKLARVPTPWVFSVACAHAPATKCIQGRVAPARCGGVPLYPLSLLLLLPGYLRCRVCSPKTLVGLAREPVSFLYPSTNLSLSWELSEQLPGSPRGCAAPFCVQNMSPTASSLGPRIFPVSCIIFPHCTDKNKCLAQGHGSARCCLEPRLQTRMLCWGLHVRLLLGWQRENCSWLLSCCRALVFYSFLFYCAEICITSILPFFVVW